MFSTKILSKDYSRSFGVIKDAKTNKVLETLYLTPLVRELKHIKNDFKKDIKEYCSKITDSEFHMDDTKYLFEIVPNFNNTKNFREIFVMYGGTGSGKSYTISNIFKRFLEAFKKKNLIYISPNNVDNDESLAPLKNKIKEVDIFKLDSPINVYDDVFQNALVAFDDTDSNSFSYNLEDLDPNLTEENLANLDLKQKNKVASEAEKSLKTAIKFVNESLKKFCWEARKNRTSLIYIYHDFFQGSLENMLIGEANRLIIFPYKMNRARFLKWTKDKLGLEKSDAEFIANHRYYMYDFCMLDKQDGKMFMMTPDLLKIF